MKLLSRSSFGSDRDWELYNRISVRILPYVLLLYIVSFLDRVNVGFAQLQMSSDIGLTPATYGFGAGVFFFGYCLFNVPSTLMLERLGSKAWITRIMLLWGVVSTCTIFVRTPHVFYAMRLLLGISEAGFYPGVVLYLTYWYPSRLRSQVWAIFSLGVPLAGIIGAPVSGWIMRSMAGTAGLKGWQWLFIIEGLPSIILGVVTYFFLANNPSDAGWLSSDEKEFVLASVKREHSEQHAKGYGHRIGDAFADPNVWLLAVTNFGFLASTYGVSFWLPQIVKDLGVKDLLHNGMITAIPYGAAGIGMMLISRHSDRKHERRVHGAFCALTSVVGLILTGTFATSPVPCLVGMCLTMIGALGGLAMVWALPGTILFGTAAATAMGIMATFGNLSGYVSPQLIGYVKDRTQHVDYALYTLAAINLLGAITMLLAPKLRGDQGNALRNIIEGTSGKQEAMTSAD